MDLKEYISTVNQKYRAGNATEHSYRGALEQLMQTLLPKLRIVNEPKRVKCGAPDYIASRKDGMPVFYIEAKDIGDNDLDGRNPHGHKEQFTRYKQALDYIIFTDYLDFHLYEHGEFVDSVRIAEVKGDKIVAINENEEMFLNLIEHVGNNAIQRITSASRLAKLMAGKALGRRTTTTASDGRFALKDWSQLPCSWLNADRLLSLAERPSLYQRRTILRRCVRISLELLHRRLPACPEMAQRPKGHDS